MMANHKNNKSAKSGKDVKSSQINKKKRILIFTTAVVAVCVCAIMCIYIPGIYKNFTALTINESRISIADFDYFYFTSYYNDYFTAYEEFGTEGVSSMPGRNSLSSTYYDKANEITYKEYYENKAVEELERVTFLCNEANLAGYVLPETINENYEREVEELDNLLSYDSAEEYLRETYGKTVNKKTYCKNLKNVYLADAYYEELLKSFECSDEEYKEFYSKHADAYDTVIYRYFYINGYSDGVDNMKEAKKIAEEFADKVTDEESYINLSWEYTSGAEKYDYEDSRETLRVLKGEHLRHYFSDWLLSPDREYGDVTVKETLGGYCVLFFVERNKNEYSTKNVQYILVSPEKVTAQEYESEQDYKQALKNTWAEAEKLANEIYDLWLDTNLTYDNFIMLSEVYSNSAASGDITDCNLTTFGAGEATEWCFSQERKTGDYALIKDSQDGYYIIRYAEDGEPYNIYLAKQVLLTEKYEQWYDEMRNSSTINEKFFKALCGR